MQTNLKQEINSQNIVNLYLLEIGKYKLLTKEEERDLVLKMKNGDLSAREQLIQSNLRLVVSIVRKYSVVGLDIFDLIQEENKGLIIAIDRFDPSLGCRISTYATNWIKKLIKIAMEDSSKNIRIPNNVLTSVKIYKRIKEDIFKETGKMPTYKEIARKMNISANKVLELSRIQHNIVSLNTTIDEDENIELGEISLATEDSSEEIYLKQHSEEEFLNLIKECCLTEKELEILILRFGFLENKTHTLEEIGKIYRVSRERVRQIEKKFLKKINESNNLEEMLLYGTTPRKILKRLKKY